ncbi:MAG: aldo/keto reductase [Chitinophagaceae bacterium]|nr:aldo/keto reductase [Chitinophagaceae bacterium]
MGINYGVNNSAGKIPENTAFDILNHAYDNGIRCLDTAQGYGTAHELIGRFHRKHPSKEFRIITKLPHGFDESRIEEIAAGYRADLGVAKLDVLMFHGMESYFSGKDIIHTLGDQKSRGAIGGIGVSVYTNEQAERIGADDRMDVIQLPFNLLDNISLRGNTLKELKAKGKIIHTRSAFLQGLFFLGANSDHRAYTALKTQIAELQSISKEYNTTIPQMALAYCLAVPEIDNVLIGVDSVAQLMTNLEAVSIELPENMVRQINDIRVTEPNWLNPTTWN